MKELYIDKRQHPRTLAMVAKCDAIITDYSAQGYKLTIRQLYYQLVAKKLIPNTVQSYDTIVQILTNARLSGLLDWDAIEDRTRSVESRSHWLGGDHILRSAAHSYHEDLWEDQESRILVVVEKEALAGVLDRVCTEYDVPMLAARGYPSATTLREVAKTLIMGASQNIVVLHLGDHDPSGIDMSRDLVERLRLFSRNTVNIDFRRLALNMDQVEELKPPPNPAKVTDSRYGSYLENYGAESWELDALPPKYLHSLVAEEIKTMIDWPVWNEALDRIANVKDKILTIADNFEED